MKTKLLLSALAALTIGFLGSCSKINERIDDIDSRVDSIEQEKIASIGQQIATINSSIADLSTIRTNIQNLKNEQEAQGRDITALKAADITLEGKINDLKAYVDTELAKYATKDWANATFATLEQLKTTENALESLKETVDKLGDIDGTLKNLKAELSDSIASAISSLAGRVNKLENAVDELKGRVDDLEHRIQSVTIIPAYNDGSVKNDNGTLTINCIISPASAVSGLTKSSFKLLLNKVRTKAAEYETLNISTYTVTDAASGEVEIKADISGHTTLGDGKALTAALRVKDFTTDFVGVFGGITSNQTIPASHSGVFTLVSSDKVILTIEDGNNNDITLEYAPGSQLPKQLVIKVDGTYGGKISGKLPYTTVQFDAGKINTADFKTAENTFVVIHPAIITTKLIVEGGNVLIKGATVAAIEVAAEAFANPVTKAPVQIVVEKSDAQSFTAPIVTAHANVIVAPAYGVEVQVTAVNEAKVANEGAGTVKNGTTEITTKAAAQIGKIKYITLADAVKAAPSNATTPTTITLLENVTDGAGIFLAAADKKDIVIDLNNKTYTAKEPAVGSSGTENQAFHLEKDNTVVIKNGTLTTTADSDEKNDFRFVIQNYADLTLEDITLDGTSLAFPEKVRYTVSNNSGNVVFKGATIKAATENGIAFDVCKYGTYPVPTVTWKAGKSAGTVNGGIELSGGKFVVETNLSVSAPVLAAEGESTLEIDEGATLSPATNFYDPNPNISNHNTGTAPVQVKRGASLTISGDGVVDSKTVASAVIVTVNGDDSSKTAKLTVNGKVTLQGYYYGISGNGNRQNTEVTINGGTIKGTNVNDCVGIYNPQKGSLTINGGTIEGAVGIYVKAGNVTTTTTGGTITGIGTKATFNHYDGGVYNTGDAFVVENCGYPGGTPNVNISGGTFISTNASAVASYAYGDGNQPITGFILGGTFSDLSGVTYVKNDAIYTLGANVANAAGMAINTEKKFTVDFGGHTYTVNKPGAGSTNTETLAFQLLAGQTITFKNGTIKAATENLNATESDGKKPIKRFIQNYANLTLTDMTLDGTNINGDNSVVEFCHGNVTIDGTTNFTAKSGVASINVDSWKGSYPNGTAVTINTTGNVGKIHCYTEGDGSMTTKSSLTITNGKNITIDDVSNGDVVVSIEGGTFSDLSGVKYVADNATYTLGADVTNAAGMAIDTGKAFTVDFGGHTYTVNKPGAGSINTETSAFQLLKEQTITFKNGTIKAATENLDATESDGKKPIKRFIQNYANLTLTDMTLDGTNINGDNSVVEFCNGNVVVDGSTTFTAKTNVASINVDSWTAYPNGTNVTINTTGKVGKIYCYSEGSGQMTTKSKLTIVSGEDITIEHKTEGDVDVDVDDQRTN